MISFSPILFMHDQRIHFDLYIPLRYLQYKIDYRNKAYGFYFFNSLLSMIYSWHVCGRRESEENKEDIVV